MLIFALENKTNNVKKWGQHFKFCIKIMKTVDMTEGRRPNIEEGEEFMLTVTFWNGAKYCYYGETKKEAEAEFKKKWGSYRGFISKEWQIV